MTASWSQRYRHSVTGTRAATSRPRRVTDAQRLLRSSGTTTASEEQRPRREGKPAVFRSVLATLEEVPLLILPHGGQRTARRNAWRAATDLHVTSGYRWTDGGPGSATTLAPVTP